MNYSKITNKSIILKYGLPQMIGLIFNSIYFIIDGMFIGHRLGSQGLASAGVAIPIVEAMIALSMLLSVGAGVIIASSLGKKDTQKAQTIFNQTNMLTLYISLGIVVLGNLFIEPLARFLGASSSILPDTVIYLRYFLTAAPFMIFSFTLSTFARNDNAPKLAMWALIVGSLSNILLDWVFMYPLNMGMAGAALATALGPVFSVLLLLPHFLLKKGILSFKMEFPTIRDVIEIFKNGMAAFITNFSIGLVTLFYNLAIVYNGLGDIALSSYVIIGYLSLIAITAFLGSSQGIQPAISYFDGAREHERIFTLVRDSVIFNSILAIVFYLTLVLFGKDVLSLFTQDLQVIAYTQNIIPIYFTNLLFASVNIVVATMLQALNFQKDATVLSLMRSTLPLIIFLILLPLLLSNKGIWLAVTVTEGFTLLFTYHSWSSHARTLKKVRYETSL